MSTLKLGLKPFTPSPLDLPFSKYRTAAPLPKPPIPFGHADVFPADGWLMLGNDRFGDCAFAGPAHQIMGWNKIRGVDVPFNDACVLQCYGECTGFDPATGANDNGTDMHDLADYWVKTGILDANGKRHFIAGYVFASPGNLQQLAEAAYLFDSVGFGFSVPQSAMDQFQAGQVWDVVEDDGGIVGGHYVPVMGEELASFDLITWAAKHGMTPAFVQKYCTAVLVPITQENLINGKSPEGFDYATLQSDLQQLAA